MSFVEWVTALALLVVAMGGFYAGVMALVRRRWEYGPYTLAGSRAIIIGLLYLAGGAVAFLMFGLLLLTR